MENYFLENGKSIVYLLHTSVFQSCDSSDLTQGMLFSLNRKRQVINLRLCMIRKVFIRQAGQSHFGFRLFGFLRIHQPISNWRWKKQNIHPLHLECIDLPFFYQIQDLSYRVSTDAEYWCGICSCFLLCFKICICHYMEYIFFGVWLTMIEWVHCNCNHWYLYADSLCCLWRLIHLIKWQLLPIHHKRP